MNRIIIFKNTLSYFKTIWFGICHHLILWILINLCILFVTDLDAQEIVPTNLNLDEVIYVQHGASKLTLFIAYPKVISEKLPTVIHIHGGGFRKGSASKKNALLFAKNGFVGISINYRLSGDAVFPAAVHDCKTSVRWARAHADQYGIDTSRIGVFGGSAGGYLALMLGTSRGDTYLEAHRSLFRLFKQRKCSGRKLWSDQFLKDE